MIYFDLDGVIRDLSTKALGYPASHWWHTVNGKNVVELINEDLSILLKSEPTEYYPLIKELPELDIITHQPDHWKARTTEWIAEHFAGKDINVLYVDSPEEKMSYLGYGDYLVEDYPYFKDYSHVILIDRPYNKQVEAGIRICNPNELKNLLNTMAGS